MGLLRSVVPRLLATGITLRNQLAFGISWRHACAHTDLPATPDGRPGCPACRRLRRRPWAKACPWHAFEGEGRTANRNKIDVAGKGRLKIFGRASPFTFEAERVLLGLLNGRRQLRVRGQIALFPQGTHSYKPIRGYAVPADE